MKAKLSSAQIRLAAAVMRRQIVEMDYLSGAGHIGGSLSCTDILATLFLGVMDTSPARFRAGEEKRDRFVLSKGHCTDAYFSILALCGYFPWEELKSYDAYASRLSGHPTTKVDGVEINTGALGHGLPVSVGMAKAAKMSGNTARVFTLLGDGELAEGSNWEAAMAAAHYRLDHLTAIIDRNGLQIGGPTEEVMALENLEAKWRAFGWETLVVDGHDIDALRAALDAENASGLPRMIIAKTIKGKGVSYMENIAKWHHGTPDEAQYLAACRELDDEIQACEADAGEQNPHPFTRARKESKPASGKGSVPARKAITDTLLARAKSDRRLCAVTCDARGSASLEDFAKELPQAFIETGIAEQDAVGIAAGLAVSGKIPFVCSPACFLAARSYEQVKTDLSYSNTNVKLLGVSGGVAYGTLGMTHHSLQDIAVMRSLPGMHVVLPCDAASAAKLTEYAIDTYGPFYLRVGRAAVPDIYTPEQAAALDPEKAFLLREGEDIALLACGVMVKQALDAAALLEKQGISAAVYDYHTIKPFDAQTLRRAAAKYGRLATIEEATLAGGFGSLVLETLAQTPVPVKCFAFPDEPSVSGTPQDIFAHYGLDAASIAKEVYAWVSR